MEFIKCIFATYAATIIILEKDGPFGYIDKLRHKFKLFRCDTCTSFWIGAILALHVSNSLFGWAIATLALAGTTTILNRAMYG